ncbi:hypothetical protein A1O7_03278 [Cladophialophora yegresii CBS 114405]|uniref:Outer kinetochore protein DAD1 n=1 Tax=Cladophialophora yegresii CBS 114405 TaxID=1182544 RepID=W9W465_9EURO|nr:uncharacterized protein A1O7_03278 [Cladophialophora yegresii CBS 114405]EXJ62837.1 hypothetical protein A1O7_03278 [Cladophialophora yegresii CBS 114405]
MATSNTNQTSDASAPAHQHSEFELRRAAFVGDIGEIGNEFSSVEALWSQFETVMGRSEEETSNGANNHNHDHDHNSSSDPTAGGNANHEGEAGAPER